MLRHIRPSTSGSGTASALPLESTTAVFLALVSAVLVSGIPAPQLWVSIQEPLHNPGLSFPWMFLRQIFFIGLFRNPAFPEFPALRIITVSSSGVDCRYWFSARFAQVFYEHSSPSLWLSG